jgi:hypothetical protein
MPGMRNLAQAYAFFAPVHLHKHAGLGFWPCPAAAGRRTRQMQDPAGARENITFKQTPWEALNKSILDFPAPAIGKNQEAQLCCAMIAWR